jgi:pimeloyl-ACP methyl ester carboxylesterase
MDQYVGAKAQFPEAEISFIGHSNGTYLAARALRDYDDARFKNIFFAGSVVQRRYPWQPLVETGRVRQFHNVRAAKDWVVALLPKSVEYLPFFDLGGAGFNGFDDAGKHESVTQAKSYANGQHSAALIETQWDHIADFIVSGKVPEETPADDFRAKPPWWMRLLAVLHIGLPLVVVVALGLLAWIAWPLLQLLAAHWFGWPRPCVTVPQAVGHSFGVAAYLVGLKFVITRV